MKVLLKSDVKSLGKKNDVVEVSEGYARNYLFPRNLAVEATPGVIKSVQEQKNSERRREDRELAEARALAEKLKTIKVDVARKVGEGGKLFGSVAGKDIAERLKEVAKIDIDKRKFELPEHIKSLGEYKVNIRLHPGVVAELDVVVREQ